MRHLLPCDIWWLIIVGSDVVESRFGFKQGEIDRDRPCGLVRQTDRGLARYVMYLFLLCDIW